MQNPGLFKTGDNLSPKEATGLISIPISLILTRQSIHLRQRKNGAVNADIFRPDITPAALANAAFHAHLK